MIAIYALGEGLGHLTRVAAAVHTLAVDPEEVVVLTDAPSAVDVRVTGSLDVRVTHPDHVVDVLRELRPRELWVDAFPSGLRGELGADVVPASVTATRHLARLLRWDAYGPLLGAHPIEYDVIHVLEPLTDEHSDRLAMLADDLAPLELRDPPASVPDDVSAWFDLAPGPRWLVVHAGPTDELEQLVDYATETSAAEDLEPTILLAAPQPVRGRPAMDCYPAWPLFARADRVITAAGFNVMRQAHRWAGPDRHRFVPFRRRYDDQFERARRARSCTNPA